MNSQLTEANAFLKNIAEEQTKKIDELKEELEKLKAENIKLQHNHERPILSYKTFHDSEEYIMWAKGCKVYEELEKENGRLKEKADAYPDYFKEKLLGSYEYELEEQKLKKKINDLTLKETKAANDLVNAESKNEDLKEEIEKLDRRLWCPNDLLYILGDDDGLNWREALDEVRKHKKELEDINDIVSWTTGKSCWEQVSMKVDEINSNLHSYIKNYNNLKKEKEEDLARLQRSYNTLKSEFVEKRDALEKHNAMLMDELTKG